MRLIKENKESKVKTERLIENLLQKMNFYTMTQTSVCFFHSGY